MKEEMQIKRQALKDPSKAVMSLIEMEQAATVNEALVLHYAEQGHHTIKSYRKWREEGFQVRKGEKALLLWGEPIKTANQEKKQDNEKDEFKFYPLAYVFSQLQVDKVKEALEVA